MCVAIVAAKAKHGYHGYCGASLMSPVMLNRNAEAAATGSIRRNSDCSALKQQRKLWQVVITKDQKPNLGKWRIIWLQNIIKWFELCRENNTNNIRFVYGPRNAALILEPFPHDMNTQNLQTISDAPQIKMTGLFHSYFRLAAAPSWRKSPTLKSDCAVGDECLGRGRGH